MKFETNDYKTECQQHLILIYSDRNQGLALFALVEEKKKSRQEFNA